MGFLVKQDKSELVPKRDFIFLGYHFFLKEGIVKPTEERWSRIQTVVKQFIKEKCVKVKEWQSVLRLLATQRKWYHKVC